MNPGHGWQRNGPRTFPYASGHANLVTVPSAAVVDEHVPSLYIASKICQFVVRQGLRVESFTKSTYCVCSAKRRKTGPHDADEASSKIVSFE